MPTLPSADTMQRASVQPGTGVASYQGGIAASPAVGQALSQFGADVQRMADEETARIDALRVDEAATKLRQQELGLTFGEKGYQGVRGSAVLSRPLGEEYAGQYKQAAEGIAQGLTPKQKAVFNARAANGQVQFQANVLRHSMIESDKVADANFKAGLELEQQAVARLFDNPEARAAALANTDALLAKRFEREGITGALREDMVRTEHGKLHAVAVDGFIQNDRLVEAAEYLKANKGDMTPDQSKAVEARLKPLADDALGTDIAIEAFTKLKTENKSPVEVALWLAEKTKGNPRANSSASTELARLQAADKAEDEQARGEFLLRFMQSPTLATESAIRKDVLKSAALTDGQKASVLKDIDSLAHTEQSQQREDIRWSRYDKAWTEEQKGNKLDAFMRYTEILYSPDFATKSPAQLAAYAADIGPALAKNLLSAQKETQSAAGRFQIDRDLLNEAVPEKVLKDKGDLNAFRGIVESNLQEWKINNPGKIPAIEQQREIARSALATWRDFKGWDSDEPAYKATPGRSVPQDFYSAQVQLAQSKGIKPTEAWVLDRWKAYSAPPTREFETAAYNAAKARGQVLSPAQVRRMWQLNQMGK